MYPEELRYARSHEWVRQEVDGRYAVGLTAYAVEQLGDITYVELPDLELEVVAGGEAGSAESVKAVSDLYAPVGGKVVEINDNMEDNPEVFKNSPYGDAWIFKLDNVDSTEIAGLMGSEAYAEYVAGLDT